jgi:S1-C subfamily serine protease
VNRLLGGVAFAALMGGCAPDAAVDPESRAVTLRTTACGDASGTTGSGVQLDDRLALTAAHVVAGADEVFLGDDAAEGHVVLLDPTRDLALLEFDGDEIAEVELGEVEAGDPVRIVGGSASGTVAATVARRVVMDIDDVRAATRSERVGYELDALIAGGDSGAGVYAPDGALVGIVFAVPTERDGATFAVGAAEIGAVLESGERSRYVCDPVESQLVPVD